jgi:predicted Zn finger-like uncharacterized protein
MLETSLLIHCPHCQASFRLPQDVLARRGLDVRCTSCFTCWHLHEDGTNGEILSLRQENNAQLMEIEPDELGLNDNMPLIETASPSLVPDKENGVLSTRKISEPVITLKKSRQISKKLVLSIMLSIAVVGFIAGRQSILRNFPKTAPLYSAIGFNTNILGLDFKNVVSSRLSDKGQDILLIEGKIGNITREVKQIPAIHLTVRTREGKNVYSWVTKPSKATLEPYESFDFKTRLASPPLEGHDVSVRFVNESDIAKQ